MNILMKKSAAVPKLCQQAKRTVPPWICSERIYPYLEPRARMMQGWADYLEQVQRGGKVLTFRGSAA